MKRYISHYEFTVNKAGRVIWARDLITGKFVKRAIIESMLKPEPVHTNLTEFAITVGLMLLALFMLSIPVMAGLNTITISMAIMLSITAVPLFAMTVMYYPHNDNLK